MNYINSFDNIFAYNLFHLNKRDEDASNYFLFGVLIDGVNDFDQFSNQIKKILHPNSKIIQIYKNLAFISFFTSYNYLIKKIKHETQLFHFNFYSIFPKKQLANAMLKEFVILNKNLFYIYYEDKILQSDQILSQNAKYFNFTNSHPRKYLYGFDSFSDLVTFYIELIENHKKWPVFAICPSKANSNSPKNSEKRFIKENHILAVKSTSINPIFTPFKFLFYFSFIEKNPPKPKKMMNTSEIYSIHKINDVQISHLDNEKSNYLTIRTFLGFDTKFQCILAFDHLSSQNSDLFF